MLADFDYTGAAALVAAFGGVIASILAFLARQKVATVAEHAENIQAAVSTSNGYTLGEIADRTEALQAGTEPPTGQIKQINP